MAMRLCCFSPSLVLWLLAFQAGRLDGPGVAFGRVRDPAGRPVAGATVVLRRHLPTTASAEPATAATDATGRFRFAGLASGAYDLAVRSAGFAPVLVPGLRVARPTLRGPLNCGPIDLGSITLRPGAEITGVVVDSAEEPVGAVEVRAFPGGPAAAWTAAPGLPAAVTDAEGRFTLADLDHRARWFLQVERTGYAPRVVAAEAGKPLRLVLSAAAEVSGKVVDEAGDPIAGALVFLEREDGPEAVVLTAAATPQESVRSDPAGRFTLRDVRPGPARLLAFAHPYLPATPRTLELAPGGDGEELEVVLRRGAVVEGRVTTTDGLPLARAWVRLAAEPGDPVAAAAGPPGTVTDETGWYRLEGVPPGRRHIVSGSAGRAGSAGSTLAALEVAPGSNLLDLQMGAPSTP
jgi:protocatechuate 3,4-dioxygenase beta subunit